MMDEQFERDVRAAARRVAGHGAPDSLRARVVSITASHPRALRARAHSGARASISVALIATLVVIAAVALGTAGLPSNRGSTTGATVTPEATAGPTSTSMPKATVPVAAASTPPGLPEAVELVHVYGVEPDLMAASNGKLFGVAVPASSTNAVVLRIDPDGSIIRRTISDPLAGYYSQLVAQGSSLYLGTSVIRRFIDAADELIRVDASTLTVAARTTLAGGVVGLVAEAQDVWVALPDRVLRLDPVSLAVRASTAIPGAVPPPGDASSVSSIALGPAELLVTVGGSGATTLYRFDRTTLSLRGKTVLPEPGLVSTVVAGPESIWLTASDWVQRVDPSGQLGTRIPSPGLQAAAAQGNGVLALVGNGSAQEALIQIDAAGAIVGSSTVGDAGGRIAIDGQDVWLLQGLSVGHWRLVARQP